MRCEVVDLIKIWNGTTQQCEDTPCQWSPYPFSYNFYKISSCLDSGDTFKTNPFNYSDPEGAYRATSRVPTVAEIGRTQCNYDSNANPVILCYSRWGKGANNYETTIISNPF